MTLGVKYVRVILMYSHFKGIIEEKLSDKVVIDVNSIGYEIYMPENEIEQVKIDEKIMIFTHFHVREDDMRLFGFLSKEKLSFFKKLIGVSGVGPKAAMGIISNISVSDMCVAIATENILALKSIPGIGPKMAQKIIFELKDKVVKEQLGDINKKLESVKSSKTNENILEATTALEALGFSKKSIDMVLSKIDVDENSVEEIIRRVLKEMQK